VIKCQVNTHPRSLEISLQNWRRSKESLNQSTLDFTAQAMQQLMTLMVFDSLAGSVCDPRPTSMRNGKRKSHNYYNYY